jgi:hypothetical protein
MMPRHRMALALVFVVTCAAAAAPQAQPDGPAQRSYTTRRTEQPPQLDGRPEEACWNAVEWSTDFVQWQPTEGQPPTYQTAFKILYDDHFLYIAYRCFDAEPQHIENQLARRDNFPGDWVEINIDSYLDHRTAYSFTSSVSETRGDEFVSSDGDSWDGSWDPIWTLTTHVDAQGWTAEIAIPFSQLRFVDQEEQVWGIQVQRRLFRKEERSLWQPKQKAQRGWVSRFGELRGIRGVRPQRQVELLPYGVTRGESFEKVPNDPFRDGKDMGLEAGMDGKIGVSSNLTLDFTVNPDFGQVEADPSEVNLSAFETQFSEKRPFFIEGNSILDFQVSPAITGGDFSADNLFYTRRIGRPPHGDPEVPAGQFADIPSTSSILLASKLTGRTGNGLSLGALESVTGEERASIGGPGIAQHEQAVEPLTNFFVGRMQQDLSGGNTRFGGMLTSVHRKLNGTELGFLPQAAWTGGLDFYHAWHDRAWYVTANAAASRLSGSTQAMLLAQTASARYFQRPDNDYAEVDSARTSLFGHAGNLALGKTGGKRLRFETGGTWRSPGFEINDIGYMRHADEVTQYGWMQYSKRNPFSIFREFYLNTNEWLRWDCGGTSLLQQGNANFNLTFKNFWSCGGGATRAWHHRSNTALWGGPSMLLPGQWSSWAWVNSDSRQPLSAEMGASFTNSDAHSLRYRDAYVSLRWRPTNAVLVRLDPSYSHTVDELQYVTTARNAGAPRYLLGTIDENTAALTFRLDVTLRPNLTVQYYGAPFLANGSYSEFKQVTAPHASGYEDRFHVYGPGEIQATGNTYQVDENRDGTVDYAFRDPDFEVRDFNSNLVLRWEYQPGSLLYVVWSQARSSFVADGRLALREDVSALFDVQPHDVFLVKLSKWFSL